MKKANTQDRESMLAHANVVPLFGGMVEKNRWPMVYEQKSDYQISSIEPEVINKYKQSLSKRRLLKLWEQHRKEVRIAPFLPEIIRGVVFENVYSDIKQMLASCYYEDFQLPLMEITLQSWLHHQKNVSEELDKSWDTLYWEEMIQFLNTCSKLQLLHDLQQQGIRPTSKH